MKQVSRTLAFLLAVTLLGIGCGSENSANAKTPEFDKDGNPVTEEMGTTDAGDLENFRTVYIYNQKYQFKENRCHS